MIFNRQRMLLLLLRMAGGEASKLQIMKWSFLISETSPSRGGESFYQFLPFRFGPYSFCLDNEMTNLMKEGLVRAQDSNTWKLTLSGAKQANNLPNRLSQDVHLMLRRYGFLKTDELIDLIYSEYPWFTVNCDTEVRCLQERPIVEPKVYTIGYGGFSIDGFLNCLMRNGIYNLIDVRNNPSSRKYGFSKKRLSNLCVSFGIDYLNFPDLGIPHQQRRNVSSNLEFDKLFDTYICNVLSQQGEALSGLVSILDREPSVLMCVESNPHQCHRSHLAEAISNRGRLEICHL